MNEKDRMQLNPGHLPLTEIASVLQALENRVMDAWRDFFATCNALDWERCGGSLEDPRWNFYRYVKFNDAHDGRTLNGVTDITCNGHEHCYTVIGYENLNAWHHVSIRHVAQNDYGWVNSAGVTWSLRNCTAEGGEVYCLMGNDCPYADQRGTIVQFNHQGVFGPYGEFYMKKTVSRQLSGIPSAIPESGSEDPLQI